MSDMSEEEDSDMLSDDESIPDDMYDPDLGDHFETFSPEPEFIPTQMLDHSAEWRTTALSPNKLVEKFMGPEDTDNYRYDFQVIQCSRYCCLVLTQFMIIVQSCMYWQTATIRQSWSFAMPQD